MTDIEQIKKKRAEEIKKFNYVADSKDLAETILALVAEVEKLEAENKSSFDDGWKQGWDNATIPWKSAIQSQQATIDKLVKALEFYGDNMNWLYNEIKKSDCDIQTTANGKELPKGLEFESGGKIARQCLAEIKGEK